uniref:Uncharacterized protein n=1 Tax=Sphaeramia orbicularis TaxID=375764 RepID=A0A673BN48_9TELE
VCCRSLSNVCCRSLSNVCCRSLSNVCCRSLSNVCCRFLSNVCCRSLSNVCCWSLSNVCCWMLQLLSSPFIRAEVDGRLNNEPFSTKGLLEFTMCSPTYRSSVYVRPVDPDQTGGGQEDSYEGSGMDRVHLMESEPSVLQVFISYPVSFTCSHTRGEN